jgi:hypothetical protein
VEIGGLYRVQITDKEKCMHRSIIFAVLVILISGLAQAQSQTQTQPKTQPQARAKAKARSRIQPRAGEERKMQVYALAGLGRISAAGIGNNRFQIGGGVDALVYKGFSVGGEFSRASAGPGRSFNIFSANGSYHFLNGSKAGKFDPFVSGGYSRFAATNAVNFGGGTNYWLSNQIGVRFDIRPHLASGASFVGARGGVVFGF